MKIEKTARHQIGERLGAADAAAMDAFRNRIPEIIAALRNRVSRPIGEDGVAEIRHLVEEAGGLAAAARLRDTAWPLVYLADDVARGASPRKALQRYLDVADVVCAEPGSVSGRHLRDAQLAIDRFMAKSSVFC